MRIDIETLKETKGIGVKTLERIIEQHNKRTMIEKDRLRVQSISPPVKFNIGIDNIYQGESVEFMRNNIPNDSIDMVLTSPPYDNLRDYNGFYFDYKVMLSEIHRVLKKGGVCVWVVADQTINGSESGTSFRQALYAKEIGFNLHDTMIYQKNSYPFPMKNRYYQVFEYMFVLSKGTPSTYNLLKQKTKWKKDTKEVSTTRLANGETVEMKYEKGKKERILDNVWICNTGYMRTTKDKIAYKHPAQFPEELAEKHILTWSNEGDIVLDPMCGSGTTCKMAKLNNRKFIGIDISKEYVKIAKERIEEYKVELFRRKENDV